MAEVSRGRNSGQQNISNGQAGAQLAPGAVQAWFMARGKVFQFIHQAAEYANKTAPFSEP